MVTGANLLVVDDEQLYCDGCQRIFSRQGFHVDQSSEADQGLRLAVQNDYDAILLDVKMPEMDGMEFLEELRIEKPDVPVVLMTGFPSIPSAASAVRLGASDYVTKPFTPEEITRTVHKLLEAAEDGSQHDTEPAPSEVETWLPADEEFQFFNRSWFQSGHDGTVRVGALLPLVESATGETVRLPRIGEVVYQGLPLVGLTTDGKVTATVPSPVTGVVVAVNPKAVMNPSLLWGSPCREGWIACVAPTRLREETRRCEPRHVVLANADTVSAEKQAKRLATLGCRVHHVADYGDLASILPDPDCRVLLLDEASFGAEGLEWVDRVKRDAPSMRLVVLASEDSQREAAYRARSIFYYAVEPFADYEIVEILNSLFRGKRSTSAPPRRQEGKPIESIRITNRNGHKVCLLAPGGILDAQGELGRLIDKRLLDRLFPMETILGDATMRAGEILETANKFDHVFVLLAEDGDRLPGSLVRDSQGTLLGVPGQSAEKLTVLAIQSTASGTGLGGLDAETVDALADLIVDEMATA